MNKTTGYEMQKEKLNLSRTFTFFFSYTANKAKLKENYENEIKQLGSFNTVEDFWSYYQHMVRPDKLPVGCRFALFQEGIKPVWEDKENHNGGGFYLRIKRNYANKFWEDLLLGFIGEQCSENDDICGLNLNIKQHEINISIWTKSLSPNAKKNIEDWIRKSLDLNDKIELDYKHHPKQTGEQGPETHHKPAYRKIERNDDNRRKNEGE